MLLGAQAWTFGSCHATLMRWQTALLKSGFYARGGFLPRHDEDLREPLVRRQGSQVSMRVARGSASWLSLQSRGLSRVFSSRQCQVIWLLLKLILERRQVGEVG